MKICELADITQGSILTRIKSLDGNGKEVPAVTMQELSYYVNSSDDIGEKNLVNIETKRLENACFTFTDDVLVGLSSGKAMVVDETSTNQLVLSNFIRIRINDKNQLDPKYLCWLFNENKDTLRSIASLTQGTSRVSIIPLAFLKEIEIKLIPIEEQRIIGKVYDLLRHRQRIRRKKEELSKTALNEMLMKAHKQ